MDRPNKRSIQRKPADSVGSKLQSAAVPAQTAPAMTPEPDFPSIHSSFQKAPNATIASKTEADELVVIDDQEKDDAKDLA